MPSLRFFFALAVMISVLAGTFHTLRGDFARRDAAEEKAMAALAGIWQSYQMPMPPPGARLVRFPIKPRSDWSQFSTMGFSVPDSRFPPSGKVLCGEQLLDPIPDHEELMPEDPTTAGQIDVSAPEGILGLSSFYGLAVQCQAQGWPNLANRLFRRASGNRPSPADLGYQLVWQHLLAEVLKPGSDRVALTG